MQVAILAGGQGTRMREHSEYIPKPMVDVGGRPILWHIMQIYAQYGHSDFIVCLGYKGNVIRNYFLNYRTNHCDFTVTLGSSNVEIHNGHLEYGWRVTLAETGEKSMTAGRLRRAKQYIHDDVFLATYGDGVADIDIDALLRTHYASGKLATVTAVRPSSRFGELSIEEGVVQNFREKPQVANSWVNGGFLVLHKSVLDMVTSDQDTLEADLLVQLADEGQLAVYKHDGFWQCMDTFRESEILNGMCRDGRTPWLSMRPRLQVAKGA